MLSGTFLAGTRSGSVTYRFSIHWSGVPEPDVVDATVHFAHVMTTAAVFATWAKRDEPSAKEMRFSLVGDGRIGQAEVTRAPEWAEVTTAVVDDGRAVIIRVVPASTAKVDLGQIEVSTDHPVRSRSVISAYAWIKSAKSEGNQP